MLIPLGVLAVGSILAGMIWYNAVLRRPRRDERLVRHPARTRRPARSSREAADGVAPQAVRAGRAGGRGGAGATRGAREAARRRRTARRMRRADRRGLLRAGQPRDRATRTHAPAWVKASPFFAMLIGAGGRLLVLHREPGAAGGAGAEPAGALPLPAQQVVLRRDLRLPLRAAGELARHAALEGGRRRRRSTAR